MKNVLIYLAMVITLLTIAACGGGGGGSVQIQQTTAKPVGTLSIILTGSLPVNTAIAGVDFTLTLPANVTPLISNNAVASGVVSLSGTFTGSTLSPQVNYTAATPGNPGTLRVILTSSAATGVTQVGEVATISLQLDNGAMPSSADFTMSSVNVIDATLYNTINGMGAKVSNLTLQQ